MILKSIEMKGFKSFPQKTLLTFPDGIISIIGPNGSGKSNVLDAVRWVLGEKSAKNLRGEKMEDVIFSGTKIHKSMNFCEVEIIFINEDRFLDIDFTEVAIKRKAYRNGESKFYINGIVCRQKDIKELLLDSGIGKEGYSIISQGRIDEIVNSNPAQRRKIFEEASKISKNRYQKEESQRKLENVKDNLERINDIYLEIEKQVKPLKIQSENAKKYLELRGELIKSDVNRIMTELEETTSEITMLKAILDEKNQKISFIDMQLNEFDNEIKLEEEQLEELESLTFKKNNEKSEMLVTLSTLKNKLEVAQNTIENGKEQIRRIEEQRKSSKEKVVNAEINYIEKIDLVKGLESKLQEYELTIQELYSKNQEKEGNLKQIEIKLAEINENINNHKNKMSILKSQKNNIKEREAKEIDRWINLESDEKKQREKINHIKFSLEKKKKEYVDINQNIEDFKLEYKNINEKILKFKESIEAFKEKLNTINSSAKEIAAKKNLYEDMEKHYEGMSNSVKFVLKDQKLAGIIDVIGNLISVKKEYERAIEAALGGSIQNIVTETSEDAKKAIEYLKKNKQGRVTFLPLDAVKGSRLEIKNEIIASDLVSCDPKFINIVTQLLGRTIVVDTMDEGIVTAKKYNQKYRIVTKGGEIFSAGGGITGGGFVKVANILSRKRAIEELALDLDNLMRDRSNVAQNKEENSAKLEITEGILKELVARIEEKSVQISNLKIDINNEKNRLDYEQAALNTINEEQKEHIRSKATKEEELRAIGSENHHLEDELKSLEFKLEKILMDKVNFQQELDRNKAEYNQKREEYYSFKGEFVSSEALIAQSNDMLTQLKEQLIVYDMNYNEILGKVQVAKEEVRELNTQIIKNEKTYSDIQKEDEKIRFLFLEQKSKTEQVKGKEKELQKERYILVEEKYQVENRYGKLENIINNANTKMEEDYQLSFEDAKNLKSEEVNQSKNHISKLKSQINSLGNINLDAIEEYEKVNERYNLFLTQKTDLELSLEELNKINSDIEKTMKTEFRKEFRKINDLFKITFKELFGGGEGELILSDEDDILNCEIEIQAQPPGKKLKGISVMSGGEKALTAIAILFAILMTRPTPFCFLDEIDAALDDINIYRYNRYIKGLAKDTQFITITHRRGTMEEADYIYGVTMEDKGVSKVVSLKLEEADNYVDN